MEFIHSSKRTWCLGFTRCKSSVISFLKNTLWLGKDALWFSKITPFLAHQIVQQRRIKMFINMGVWSWAARLSIISRIVAWSGTWRCNRFQHDKANGHWRDVPTFLLDQCYITHKHTNQEPSFFFGGYSWCWVDL